MSESMRSLLAALWMVVLPWAPVACGRDPGRALPRLTSTVGVDPFVLERVEAALAACQRDEPGATLELAKVYDANGMNELALAAYDLCLAEPGASNRAALGFLRAVALEALERPQEALAAFDAALASGDRYAPTHWRRGNLLFESGQMSAARAAFEAALALEPHSIPASLGLAKVLLATDDPGGARARLQALAERVPDERFVHALLARAQRALGDEAAAARELVLEQRATRISISDPRSAEVRARATGILVGLRQANEALMAGEHRAALALLEPLHARLPEDLALLQLLGKALVSAQEYERAIELLQASAAAHPEQFKTELFLGLAFAGKKANRKALEHLLRARTLSPAYGPTHAALGEVQTKSGQFAEAEASLARALECGETDLRTRLLLTQVQFEQRAFARALASAEQTLETFPNAVAAWTYLAEARARRGEDEAARAALAEAERRNPNYERLELVRALLLPAEASPR